MVRDTDDQESSGEHRLPLRERSFALVQASRRFDGSEASGETVEGSGRTGDDKVSRSVVEGDVELGVGRQVGVRLFDVTLQGLEGKTGDGQHGGRHALPVLHSVLHDSRLDRQQRESLLTSLSDEEEESEGLESSVGEVLEGVGRGDADGRDDTLGVTGGSLEESSELARGLVSHVADDKVLDELRQPDKRQGKRNGSEVRNGRSGGSSSEPAVDVESGGVVRGASLGGLCGKRKEDLARGSGQEGGDVRSVNVEKRLKLVKIDLK